MKLLNITCLICMLFCSTADAAYRLFYALNGLPAHTQTNVLNALAEDVKDLPDTPTPASIQKFYQNAPKTIKAALEPYGFFDTTVSSKLYRRNQTYTAVFQVYPGRPVLITHFNIKISGSGAMLPALLKLKFNPPFHVGSALNIEDYNNYKSSFFITAEKNGYINAKFTRQEILINRKKFSAEINLVFDTGPQFFFGEIHFNPNPYNSSFLARYAPFKVGDPYNPNHIFTFQNNLNGAIYFDRVHVAPQIGKTVNRHIPIKVKVVPKKANQYSLGLGYGTDTGARATVGWQWRHINNEGHYVQGLFQLSQRLALGSAAQIQYVIPGEKPATDQYVASAGILSNEINSIEYVTQQLSFNQVKKLNGWTRGIGLTLQHEESDIARHNTLLPAITFERIKTDNTRINTNNGYHIFLLNQLGIQPDRKDNFAQTQLNIIYIYSPTKVNRIILRTNLGATAIRNPKDLPLTQSFAAGGAQSVRGYGYQDLGPGTKLIVLSGEFQQQIYKMLWGAVFYDAGNAFNSLPPHLQRGVGVGLVIRSPIGPLELTLARALDVPNHKFGEGYRLQFSMGTDL